MKIKCKIIHSIFLSFLLFTVANFSFAQESKIDVYFYGVIIPPSQNNQKGITQDMFASQIKIYSELNFIDKRNSGLSENYFNLTDEQISKLNQDSIFELIPKNKSYSENNNSIIFFSKIDKIDEETWNCSLYAKNLATSKIFVKSENFLSYYKLLSEARILINQILSESTGIQFVITQTATRPKQIVNSDVAMTIEGISGTWTGEKDITKIILMRTIL